MVLQRSQGITHKEFFRVVLHLAVNLPSAIGAPATAHIQDDVTVALLRESAMIFALAPLCSSARPTSMSSAMSSSNSGMGCTGCFFVRTCLPTFSHCTIGMRANDDPLRVDALDDPLPRLLAD
jgi:hypothetical protein